MPTVPQSRGKCDGLGLDGTKSHTVNYYLQEAITQEEKFDKLSNFGRNMRTLVNPLTHPLIRSDANLTLPRQNSDVRLS
jgi:hypothetical protein